MNAWRIVGSVWPTLRVPGMSFTGTICWSLYAAVVVAKDPIPSVSKKLVTNPISKCAGDGANGVCVSAPPTERRRFTPITPRVTTTRYRTRKIVRATKSRSFAFMASQTPSALQLRQRPQRAPRVRILAHQCLQVERDISGRILLGNRGDG